LCIAFGILFVSALLFMNLSEFLKEIDDENCKEENTQSTFTAAVVEIEVETSDLCKHRMCSYAEALLEMKPNLMQYQHFIKQSTFHKADIIVFPEDGLTGFEFLNPDFFTPFVQYIPDLEQENIWNPCLNPTKYGNNSQLVEILSCFASNSQIYLVANMGRNVERNGRKLQFNSDIAFDRSGNLIAVYDKRNLFMREKEFFNQPELEIVTFSTEFGKFGLMTCFDAMYDHPFLDLVLKEDITTLVFPTAWQNIPPHLTAVGFHSGLARGAQINYLASNRKYLPKRQGGSGIYTSTGVINSWNKWDKFDDSSSFLKGSHMILAKLPIKPTNFRVDWSQFAREESKRIPELKNTSESEIFFDKFKIAAGENIITSNESKICQGILCCILSMSPSEEIPSSVIFAAFRGLHIAFGNYFMEVCLVAGIPSNMNVTFNISGTFTSSDVYPQSGTCARTVVSGNGVFTVNIEDGCSDTVAVIARRYDLD